MSETYRYYDIRGEKNMQTVARGKARDKALAETYFSEREANEAAKAVNINDYIIDFKLTNDLFKPKEYDEASFNLIRKF